MANSKRREITSKITSTRFTYDEWKSHNKQRFRMADDQGMFAERLMEESARVRDAVKERIFQNKEETDMRLKERISDVQYLKEELDDVRKDVQLELEAMGLSKERVKDVLKKVSGDVPKIVQKCITMRDGRVGIDLIHDDVEKQLLKELKTIQGAEGIVLRTLEQVEETMRELRASLYLLNRDVEEKMKGLSIDNDCLNMKESNLDLGVYHGTIPLDPANVTLYEWDKYSNEIIGKARKAMSAARLLQGHTDALLKEVMTDLKNQFESTNSSFFKRIEEMKETKVKLEMQHFEVARQANEMTKNIMELEKAIAEKEGYLALAHTRLGKRAHRPSVELVKDDVEVKLVREVVEIREKVSWLQHLLAEAQASLRHLLKIQVQLEEDLNIKTNSLKIDEVDCMTLRQSIDYHPF